MQMKIYNHLKYYQKVICITQNEVIKQNDVFLNITDDEIDLIDTIYLSSKYPFDSDSTICLNCIDIANRVKEDIEKVIKRK